ncbi:Ldh family oxidoreductase [Vibrio sp. ZSDZ65]|uniref:Ldh family oxidoreductase n=1 Tax=Vibrio qingdaonensis TaxID=2829491 RepID=A0A9X3HVS9_9VIBR|nr:Ldh family oxidoreductase [Vibrio qingdaonensis]MCW8345890.1 Ldh family oxidoreductase [Vibrio qingdaonensis]
MIRVNEAELKDHATAKLLEAGLEPSVCDEVVDVLLHAERTGVHSHGLLRVEHYCHRLAMGGINKNAQYNVEQVSPSLAIFDADDGMGHSAMVAATKHAMKLANETGLGFVSVKNGSHCGALSYFMEQVTNEGMIGISMTQTDTCVAPHGSAERFLGTNPIAFGFPVKDSHPMIVDMATSATAFGKLLVAKETGQPIGENLALDAEGNMTTDPNKVENLLTFGGHKGSGIALAIDALTGGLMGAHMSNHVVRMYDDYDKMRKLASLVIVVNPEKLGNPLFGAMMLQLVSELRATKPMPGKEKVMAPNDPQHAYKLESEKLGINIAKSVYEYLIK